MRTLPFLIGLLCLALLFVVQGALREQIVEPGQRAPAFAFQTDDGRQISRNEFGGKLLLINFWATWCVGCVREMSSLSRFATEMSKEGIVVVAVSIDRNEQAYRRFLQQLRPSFSTFRDPEGDISASFGTFRIPETYVIDRSGRVRQKYIAERDWQDPIILSEIRSFLSQ